MALKAVHVSDVPHLDHVTENASVVLCANRYSEQRSSVEIGRINNNNNINGAFKAPKFVVIGHRGNGMNKLQSPDRRMQAVKENSIMSFNTAALFPIDFIEFDVQVTKDAVPVIFHDDIILSEEQGTIFERRVTDLTLSEFMSYGPQTNNPQQNQRPLLRKTKEGKIVAWSVETDDPLCTLQEAFQRVDPRLGFNIELKFDDHIVYQPDHLTTTLLAVLQVVSAHAKDRPVLFSSFQPDAALLIRKLQTTYPVFFLTNGGTEMYYDVRRNGLEEAIKVCLDGGLQGIVSEVKGVFRTPSTVNKIKEANLSLLTYGQLNNVAEAVYMQHVMGIDGVIVDFVKEITEAVCTYNLTAEEQEEDEEEDSSSSAPTVAAAAATPNRPQFSDREVSFLLKLIPELIQQ